MTLLDLILKKLLLWFIMKYCDTVCHIIKLLSYPSMAKIKVWFNNLSGYVKI